MVKVAAFTCTAFFKEVIKWWISYYPGCVTVESLNVSSRRIHNVWIENNRMLHNNKGVGNSGKRNGESWDGKTGNLTGEWGWVKGPIPRFTGRFLLRQAGDSWKIHRGIEVLKTTRFDFHKKKVPELGIEPGKQISKVRCVYHYTTNLYKIFGYTSSGSG